MFIKKRSSYTYYFKKVIEKLNFFSKNRNFKRILKSNGSKKRWNKSHFEIIKLNRIKYLSSYDRLIKDKCKLL